MKTEFVCRVPNFEPTTTMQQSKLKTEFNLITDEKLFQTLWNIAPIHSQYNSTYFMFYKWFFDTTKIIRVPLTEGVFKRIQTLFGTSDFYYAARQAIVVIKQIVPIQFQYNERNDTISRHM